MRQGAFLFFVLLSGVAFWALPFSVSAAGECSGVNGVCIQNSFGDSVCPGGATASDDICVPSEHCCIYPAETPACSNKETNCASSCSSGSIPVTSCQCSVSTNLYCANLTSSSVCSGSCKAVCGAGETQGNACPVGGYCCTPSTTQGNLTTVTFSNPLKFDTVEGVLNNVLSTLQSIIVVLALVFIVIGAILYITSGGDEGRMKVAKSAITASLIGLALGLAAPSFLKEIGTVLGWNNVTSSVVASSQTLTEIATKVLNFLLSVVGILGVIMLVICGIMYLTAAGDENRIDTGKKIVTYSIIGIMVALAALVLVNQIVSFFA